VARTLGRAGRFRAPGTKPYLHQLPRYKRRLTDKYITTYIHRLTDKYNSLRLLVPSIFLDFGIKEYTLFIFLGTKEYTKTEEDIIFFLVLG
jgi:hypothetical protein